MKSNAYFFKLKNCLYPIKICWKIATELNSNHKTLSNAFNILAQQFFEPLEAATLNCFARWEVRSVPASQFASIPIAEISSKSTLHPLDRFQGSGFTFLCSRFVLSIPSISSRMKSSLKRAHLPWFPSEMLPSSNAKIH